MDHETEALLIAFVFCAALTLGIDITLACSCGRKAPVLDAYQSAHAVVIARVLSVEKVDEERDKVKKAGEEHIGGFGPATFVVEKV